MELVTRLAPDAIFVPTTRWGQNRFLAAGCKARCKIKGTRRQDTLGVIVLGDPQFIAQMEAAFNV